jgi:hypothetical protein
MKLLVTSMMLLLTSLYTPTLLAGSIECGGRIPPPVRFTPLSRQSHLSPKPDQDARDAKKPETWCPGADDRP